MDTRDLYFDTIENVSIFFFYFYIKFYVLKNLYILLERAIVMMMYIFLQGRFDGLCILYASFSEYNDVIKKLLHPSSASTCDYPIFVSVVGLVVYGLVMGVIYTYYFKLSIKEPNRGSAMWVLPQLLLNALLCVFMMVAACIVSVGYAVFCKNYLEGFPEGSKCSIGENRDWHHIPTGEPFNPGNYISFMYTCMIFAWIGVLFVIIQLGLGALRVYRNRHPEGHPGATKLASEKSTYNIPA